MAYIANNNPAVYDDESYWKERAKLVDDNYDNNVNTTLKKLKSTYRETYKEVNEELLKYAGQTGFQYQEKILEDTLKRIEVILLGITKLEENLITTCIKDAYIMNDKIVNDMLNKAFNTKRVLNLPSVSAVEEVLRMPLHDYLFQDRLNINKKKLVVNVKKAITDGLIRGTSYEKMAKELEVQMGMGFYNCERICRTETKRAVDVSTMKNYQNHGITQYKVYTAHDNRVCKKCQELDGTIHTITTAKAGRDYLFHPNDRCTLIPVVDITTNVPKYEQNY